MAKLLENTYRHVNIALVNEMAAFCHELDIDLWDSINCAATKPFGFQAFYPGPGVGGHCIPIDPNYLGYKVRTLGYPFRFVELAQEINADAGLRRRPGGRVAQPGRKAGPRRTGLPDGRDLQARRRGPARVAGRSHRPQALARGADLTYHDPYVSDWSPGGIPVRRAADPDAEVAAADLVILLQDHSTYDLERISQDARRILDTRGRLAGHQRRAAVTTVAHGKLARAAANSPGAAIPTAHPAARARRWWPSWPSWLLLAVKIEFRSPYSNDVFYTYGIW